MTNLLTTLATIHRLYLQIEKIEHDTTGGPRALKVGRAEMAKKRQQLEAGAAAVRQLKLDIDKRELSMRSCEAEIEKVAGRLNAAKDNKEYQALLMESETAKAAARKLEDEILSAMDKLETQQQTCSTLEAQIGEEEQKLAGLEADWATKKEQQLGRVTQLRGERDEAVAALPGKARSEFKRVTVSRGADGLASVSDGSCTGCYSTLTKQVHNDLMLGREMIFCQSCGRILYLPE